MSFHIGAVNVRWSAVFAGMAASLGLWLLLYCFGLALGLSSVSPDNPDTAKGWGIFEGVWGLVSPLIALFIGGFVAARGSNAIDRFGGAIHGLVMWGSTMVLGAFLLFTLVGGTASMLGNSVLPQAANKVIDQAQNPGSTVDRNANPNVDQNNPDLAAPPQQPQQKQQAQRDALKAADTTGKVFWAVFGALALGLLSALFGGYLGGGERDQEELTVTTTVR